MQRFNDVEAVFAALGMAPVAYRVFQPRRPAEDGADGRGPAEARPCLQPERRRGRVRPDVSRPEGPRRPGRPLP